MYNLILNTHDLNDLLLKKPIIAGTYGSETSYVIGYVLERSQYFSGWNSVVGGGGVGGCSVTTFSPKYSKFRLHI